MFAHAITRRPGPDLARGLTTADLGEPDHEVALAQHDAYVEALRGLGLSVEVLPPFPGHPDACFVEDTAVVVPEGAVITRPGAASRRGETATVAAALARHRECVELTTGTLDGGDVLIVGRRCWIGLSARTDRDGAAALTEHLERWGYTCTTLPVGAGLHLKSSVNWVGGDTLLVAEEFAGRPELAGWTLLVAPPDETYACNTLWVNGGLITPAGFPRTRESLEGLGLPVFELALSEFEKLDGGLTCLSLRF
jgi:dimethylargininase